MKREPQAFNQPLPQTGQGREGQKFSVIVCYKRVQSQPGLRETLTQNRKKGKPATLRTELRNSKGETMQAWGKMAGG